MKWGIGGELFVTIQPGVLTIYSNIIGFKVIHYLKDQVGWITVAARDFELLLHTFQKVPQTTLIILLSIGIYYLIKKLWNKSVAHIFMAIYVFEPLFVLHSRVIQTDMLQALLVSASLLSVILSVEIKNNKFLYLGGILGGLAFIEKSPSIIFLPILIFILFIYAFQNFSKFNLKRNFISWVTQSAAFIFFWAITTYAFFPVYWERPIFALKRMTIDTFLFGFKGLNTENYTNELYVASSKFSPAYLNFGLFKFSEIIVIGIVLIFAYSFVVLLKNRKKKPIDLKLISLIIFSFFYFLALQLSAKKFGRYLLVPGLSGVILIAIYYSQLFNKVLNSRILQNTFVYSIILIGVFNYFFYAPDFGAYTNVFGKLFGASRNAGGTGSYNLARYISTKYGADKTIAIGDRLSFYLFYPGDVADYSRDSVGEADYIIPSPNEADFLHSKGYKIIDIYKGKGNTEFQIWQK